MNGSNNSNQQEIAANACDLNSLDPEEFLRQFELDSLPLVDFQEYTGVDVKVLYSHSIEIQRF